MQPTLGLSTIKLESPAYYCTSYTPPCSEPGNLISSSGQYPTLSLPRSQSPHSGLTDTGSVIRVKRMRRMSSEGEETELRGGSGEGKVGLNIFGKGICQHFIGRWATSTTASHPSARQPHHGLRLTSTRRPA